MYLKKLEISGLKSFATKTILDFLPVSPSQGEPTHKADNGEKCGITVIVGPNGSGKSNIADARVWVMGEQSMKALRGKKSEDVIFAGSGKRSRLGSAQVSVYFDNYDKRIPLEFEEVCIARRVFRSGESEYSINGSRVRLQDVVDLLAKAGIGKESYLIINQGMADAVLNASPLERRAIIEDAAGVKQYQIKKERSLRKLDSTKENLERAKDLMEEIKPHLRTLKRQAEKAVQGETVIKELQDKQIKLFSHLWSNFQSEKENLGGSKRDWGAKMMNVQREVDRLTDRINEGTKEESENRQLAVLEGKRNESKNQLNQLERELIITDGRMEVEKEKQKNSELIKKVEAEAPVDLQYVKEGLEEIRKEQEKLVERISQVENLEELRDIKEFARVIQQRLFDLKAEIEKGKKEIHSNSGESRAVEKENPIISELEEKILKIREEIKKREEEIKDLESQISQEVEADKQKRKDFFEAERQLMVKQGELNKLKDQFNESKIALARVEVHEEDLRAEIQKELKIGTEQLLKDPQKIDKEALEKEITKLKLKLEQIGGIDPLVLDEYKETSERFEFLKKESEDLEKAIGSLREVIKEMEQKISEVFAATFEEINKEFTKYFRIIFGGGNASLKKVEIKKRVLKVDMGDEESSNEETEETENQEDQAERIEVGIDIFASPPGKKISSLAMLSGGERSLTSLALLFSIISHNPPPFALLDEVEAALDEANSRRFGRILQELSQNTQFVIITHNRETMRQASLLYGVTMGEDGISKLLSVRLDQVGQGGKIIK